MTTRSLSMLGAKVIMAGAAAIAIADSEKSPPSKRKAPGDDVQWIDFPSQNDESNADWGDFLTDIARHLPSEYGDHYYSNDRITHAHETTHGINSHISNQVHRGRNPAYGFYVGNNRAVLLDGPRLKLSQVAEVIPESLRGSRYQLYCIDQQKYFEDHPLYLFDEWVAYTNGVHAGVELVQSDRLEMRPAEMRALLAAADWADYSAPAEFS